MLNKQMITATAEKIAAELGLRVEVKVARKTCRLIFWTASSKQAIEEFETYKTRFTSQLWKLVAAQFHTQQGLQVQRYSGCAGSSVEFVIW